MTDKCATYRSPLALILPFIISSIIALVVVCLLSFHSAEAKELGTIITVNSTIDQNDSINIPGDCSLREAIQAANTDSAVDACPAGSGADTILVPPGIYTLTITGPGENGNMTGDLDILDSMTIQGTDITSDTVIDGNQLDRVLQVHAQATVTITSLTFRNGHPPDGPSESYFNDGEIGGGILNSGILTLTTCVITDNQSGSGGATIGLGSDQKVHNGGNGGNGGGIANTGNLTLIDCEINSNLSGFGGKSINDNGGNAGHGGGIFNSGIFLLIRSKINTNITGNGGDSDHDDSGKPGYGGGIYNTSILTVENSSIYGNATGLWGNPPNWAWPSPPHGGYGGGIYNAGSMEVASSTISDNRTGNGHKGVIYCAGSHGCYFVYYVNGGAGGGIYNTNFLRMNNSTISNNKTGNGCNEEPFELCGDEGDGGGIYNTGMITSDNCTLANNRTGINISDYWSHTGSGGGIYNAGKFFIQNSILSANTSDYKGPNCSGIITSTGYNLIGDINNCTVVSDVTDIISTPHTLLFPLADNGGDTWTNALMPGSRAIDAGSCLDSEGITVTVDQRGVARPIGFTCDIGAFEAPVYRKFILPVVMR